MKKRGFTAIIIPLIMLFGCGENKTDNTATVPLKTAETNTTTSAVTEQSTTATVKSSNTTTANTTLTVTVDTTAETTVQSSESNEAEEISFEVFSGILIDEDCSDFEDPPKHDLPCMLMDSCRASGYGLDIQHEDGSWLFYMFDDKGQELAWEYLTHTDRMSELYVTVTGTLDDDIIYVDKLEEN
jgi:hypothetical protein